MFDLGWTELLVIAMVAIIVVGPKDLPGMLRNVGQMIGRLRRMAGDFQKTFNDAVKDAERQAGLEDIRKEVDSVRELNPLNDLKKSIEVSPTSPGKTGKDKNSAESEGEEHGDASTASSSKESNQVEKADSPVATAELSKENGGSGESGEKNSGESVNGDSKQKTVQESSVTG